MRILYVNTCESAFVACIENMARSAAENNTAEEILDSSSFIVRAWETSGHQRRQVEELSALIGSVLRKSSWEKPDAVVVSKGPAPFTGLRVGLVSARTLAQVWQVELYGIEELSTIGHWALNQQRTNKESSKYVLAVTDAKRKELYWKLFRNHGNAHLEALTGSQVSTPEQMETQLRSLIPNWTGFKEDYVDNADPSLLGVYGSGPALFPEFFKSVTCRHHLEDPQSFAIAAAQYCSEQIKASRAAEKNKEGTAPDLGTEPQYLRRPDIHQGGKLRKNQPKT